MVGGWRLAAGGPWGQSLRAVLQKMGVFRTVLGNLPEIQLKGVHTHAPALRNVMYASYEIARLAMTYTCTQCQVPRDLWAMVHGFGAFHPTGGIATKAE